MLTAEGCAARRERLWGALPAECDALIVGDPSHLIYFAGYAPSPFVFRTVESGALLLLEPGRATLVADNMLGPFLEARSPTRWSPRSGTTASTRPPSPRPARRSRRSSGWPTMPGRRVGVELASVPAGVVEGLRATARASRSSTSAR